MLCPSQRARRCVRSELVRDPMFQLRRGSRVTRALVALVGSAFFALACGGKAIDTPPSFDAGAGEGGGGSSTCTPLPNCASDTKCPAADGCNTCTCSNGAWACTQLGCAAPSCPDFGPTGGTACTVEGQMCNAPGRCGAHCTCQHQAWSCIEQPCDPAPVCPPSPPPNGSACDVELDACDYVSGCGATHCYCGKTPEDSGWNCGSRVCDGGAGGG
jgi:hypothetical protein